MAFVNKCYEVTSTRLRIGVLRESVYIYGVSTRFNKCCQISLQLAYA